MKIVCVQKSGAILLHKQRFCLDVLPCINITHWRENELSLSTWHNMCDFSHDIFPKERKQTSKVDVDLFMYHSQSVVH